ncbi:hypothetical protein MASR2M78_28490 [Treponema sp.]
MRHYSAWVIVEGKMRSPVFSRSVYALIFLFAALYPIRGATLLTSDDIRARLVLESYRRAYPNKISAVEWKDGDWSATIDGKVFFWAHGRLLPEAETASWSDFKPYFFYVYPEAVRDPSSYSKERIEELRIQGDADVRISGADHHDAFRAALYGGSTRAAAERKLVKTKLLGRQVSVHTDIVEAVRRVDLNIQEAVARSKANADFIASIASLGGYNWREIRGTGRRSYHSWGLAIDIQPKKLGSKAIFWEWERERNKNWMLVPHEKRWAPPIDIIKAFEKEGFIWGGKWDFYDNMHFEYRPELHELRKVYSAVGSTEVLLAARAEKGQSPSQN